MAQVVFHLKPHVDVTRLEVAYEISHPDLSDLTQNLIPHNVRRVEFITDED